MLELRGKLEAVKKGGGEAAVQRHKGRGKMFVRERIEALVDPNTPFLETSALAANGMYNDEAPSAGIVTGTGVIQGQQTMIIANDATVKGGTYFPITVKKHLRAQEIALQNNLPCVYLVDSGRRFSTSAGGSVSRPRAFWPHFTIRPPCRLQASIRSRSARFLHRRRSLCSRHE